MSVETVYNQILSMVDSYISLLLQKSIEWRRKEIHILNTIASRAVDRVSRIVDEIDFEAIRVWKPRVVPVRWGLSVPEFDPFKMDIRFAPEVSPLYHDYVALFAPAARLAEKRDSYGNLLARTYLWVPTSTVTGYEYIPRVPFFDSVPTTPLMYMELARQLAKVVSSVVIRTANDFTKPPYKVSNGACVVSESDTEFTIECRPSITNINILIPPITNIPTPAGGVSVSGSAVIDGVFRSYSGFKSFVNLTSTITILDTSTNKYVTLYIDVYVGRWSSITYNLYGTTTTANEAEHGAVIAVCYEIDLGIDDVYAVIQGSEVHYNYENTSVTPNVRCAIYGLVIAGSRTVLIPLSVS